MVAVEFDSMGEAVRLALVAGEYAGGGLAVLLLDATDPRSEGYMAEWGVLTASVPAAAEWCRGRGNIAIDADVPAALLEALEAAGMLRMAGRSAASGMARYPLATVAGHALADMGGLPETLEEALGSTVVVEHESGGDGGAFEVGTAPAGSDELERLIAAARSEADALAGAGGWAAVRVGFGDAETIDCETSRTVYVAGCNGRRARARSGWAALFLSRGCGAPTVQVPWTVGAGYDDILRVQRGHAPPFRLTPPVRTETFRFPALIWRSVIPYFWNTARG